MTELPRLSPVLATKLRFLFPPSFPIHLPLCFVLFVLLLFSHCPFSRRVVRGDKKLIWPDSFHSPLIVTFFLPFIPSPLSSLPSPSPLNLCQDHHPPPLPTFLLPVATHSHSYSDDSASPSSECH